MAPGHHYEGPHQEEVLHERTSPELGLKNEWFVTVTSRSYGVYAYTPYDLFDLSHRIIGCFSVQTLRWKARFTAHLLYVAM